MWRLMTTPRLRLDPAPLASFLGFASVSFLAFELFPCALVPCFFGDRSSGFLGCRRRRLAASSPLFSMAIDCGVGDVSFPALKSPAGTTTSDGNVEVEPEPRESPLRCSLDVAFSSFSPVFKVLDVWVLDVVPYKGARLTRVDCLNAFHTPLPLICLWLISIPTRTKIPTKKSPSDYLFRVFFSLGLSAQTTNASTPVRVSLSTDRLLSFLTLFNLVLSA